MRTDSGGWQAECALSVAVVETSFRHAHQFLLPPFLYHLSLLISTEMLQLKDTLYVRFQEFVIGVLLRAVGKAGMEFPGGVRILLCQD